jgi:hypothetical protein
MSSLHLGEFSLPSPSVGPGQLVYTKGWGGQPLQLDTDPHQRWSATVTGGSEVALLLLSVSPSLSLSPSLPPSLSLPSVPTAPARGG